MPSQQEDGHPNRKPQTQQKDLLPKEDSLRKCLPNRKNSTQTGSHEPNRKTCPGKKTLWGNVFPTGRLTPKQQINNPTAILAPERRLLMKMRSQLTPKQQITNTTGRLAPERRLIKKMSSEQEGWHPNSKSQAKQEDSPQKEDSLRKCLPSMETDTQTTNRRTHRKTCP